VWFAALLALNAVAAPSSGPEIDALAKEVAGEGDAVTRAQRLVTWMNGRLQWVATDYEQRTAEQILIRGAGNCAELASVLERLLKPTGIQYRWVAEINVHPESAQRQADATGLIQKLGARASVFGRRHNDHRWLEVLDERTQEWVPADPSTGLVGVKRWALIRLGLRERPPAAVPAIAESLDAMIVPFVIVTHRDASGQRVDRSVHYLIDELDRLYGGKASKLPSWPKWESAVRALAPLAQRAFEGEVNLHEHAGRIDKLARVYETLRREAAAAGLHPI
jgi:hypothetical protein